MTDRPVISAIAPWFGCARMLAPEVGKLLKGCGWVGVPFAGAMPELFAIEAPTIVVGDLHRHVINLANCLADRFKGPRLYRRLRRVAFCEDSLDRSQEWCKKLPHRPTRDYDNETAPPQDEEAAFHYFVASWMGRSGKAGTVDEFNGGIAVRWNCNGGDSLTRYQSAVRSINAWRRVLRKVNLVVIDCFDFLAKVQDEPAHGIYCDPPFPGSGAKYRHTFSEADHRRLAQVLLGFRRARVVCRFYDDPFIRELYPADAWTWHHFTGRKQSNADAPEVLLTNRAATEQKSMF